MTIPDTERLTALRSALDAHPIYGAVRDVEDLKVFMAHHVYSVWDFMSLIKTLQRHVAPVRVPWVPGPHPELAYFINQLVLEEESDELPPGMLPGGARAASHFELYCHAMDEIGADSTGPRDFVRRVAEDGIDAALAAGPVPEPARAFVTTTFDIIAHGGGHGVAAALAYGREQVIPAMFRRLLGQMGVTAEDAPVFHYYLNRHVHLDEDFHGPLSLDLVTALAGDDTGRQAAVTAVAERALVARLAFWDGVLAAMAAKAPTPA